MQVDLGDTPLSTQVEMGERVDGLVESEAFRDLCEVVRTHRDGLVELLLHNVKPGADAAAYADVVGHLRGLSEFELLARGVIENGKDAAAQMRAAEEGGS